MRIRRRHMDSYLSRLGDFKRYLGKDMTQDHFWTIVADTCRSDPTATEEWDALLVDALAELAANEIVEWNHIFDDLANMAYRTDLWAAAYTINGGASDDGFYYFRCWLIGMGKTVYENAIADPDSLADVATPDWYAEGIDAEAEIYAAAHHAWMRVTDNDYDAEYPARNESTNLVGDDWDYDDEEELRKRLPRLAALFAE